jgi:secreted trypsin-like serine protease
MATGWGTNRINGALSRYLQQVEVDILTNARCTTKYGASLFNANLQVCATEVGQNNGPCQGDSGGPLVVQDSNGNWNILGLISWGKYYINLNIT